MKRLWAIFKAILSRKIYLMKRFGSPIYTLNARDSNNRLMMVATASGNILLGALEIDKVFWSE